jgi:lincosamide and streptogramin A transport system ATP-binding/permease protein
MSVLQIQDLTFSYDGSYDAVFEQLTLQLDTDWRLGVVGRNGRGKTTLFRLLTGELEGRGSLSSSVPFRYFPPPILNPQEETLQVLEALHPDLPLWQVCRELSLLEVDEGVLERPFSTLSNGEQTKVLLSLLFLDEGPFPLIDEPTNHLDLEGRAKVSAWLQKKEGFFLISHDRAFLDGCVDHILALEKTGPQVFKGNFSTYLTAKQERDRYEREENQRLKKEIQHLNQAARRTAQWSERTEAGKFDTKNSGLRPDRGFIGHKAAKLMKRAKHTQARRERAEAEKAELLHNLESAPPLKLHPLRHYAQRLAEIRDLSVDYGGGALFSPLSFSLEQGERLALTGRNGAGKSSLLRLFTGQEVPHTGRIEPASGLLVSYVPQDASLLCGELDSWLRAQELDEPLFKAILRKLGFDRVHFKKDMAHYSAGQRKKVLLAQSLCQQAHLYVWDEPLNYLDLDSRLQVEELILHHQPTLLMVEHDRSFLQSVSTRIIALN